VDRNVTRHVPFELNQMDWNGMFMHYLGLDHIGHKSGPRRYESALEHLFQTLIPKKSTHGPQAERDGQYCQGDL